MLYFILLSYRFSLRLIPVAACTHKFIIFHWSRLSHCLIIQQYIGVKMSNYFQNGAIMNNTAKNSCTCILVDMCAHMYSSLLGINSPMKLLRNRQHTCLALRGTKKQCSKEFAPFYTPSWKGWEFHLCFLFFTVMIIITKFFNMEEPGKISPPDPFPPFSP